MKKSIFILSFMTFALYFPKLQAEDVFESFSATRASPQLIEKTLEALDIGFREMSNNMYILTVSEKYKIGLFNLGTSIQLFFRPDKEGVTFSRINEWNSTKRFSTAFLDQNNNPALRADLDFEGGVTGGAFSRFVLTFFSQVDQFAYHVQ